MKITIFTVFLLLVASVNCLSSNSLCLRRPCEDYEPNCKAKTKCHGRKSIECNKKYCANNERSCDEFLELSFTVRSFKIPMGFENKMSRFQAFLRSLRICR
jgi:hypothetical protein